MKVIVGMHLYHGECYLQHWNSAVYWATCDKKNATEFDPHAIADILAMKKRFNIPDKYWRIEP